MPRLLGALKSILRPSKVVMVEPTPSSSYPRSLSLLHELITSPCIQRAIPPELKSTITRVVSEYAREFVQDKSQSEVLFLTSILLAVLLFVVILPIYEALFGSCTEEDDEEQAEECSEYPPQSYVSPRKAKKQDHVEVSTSNSGSMRMYQPGVGVIEMNVSDIAEVTLLRRSSGGSGTTSSSLSIDGSLRSWASHGSMETIEESEEEDMDDEEDEYVQQDSQEEVEPQELLQEAPSSSSDVVRSTSCPDLSLYELSEEEETVQDKVRYYEFLSFCNSDGLGDYSRSSILHKAELSG